MSLTARALDFAQEKHQGQTREGASALPYLHHPLDVAGILAYLAGVADEVDLAAALLHDTVEEGGATVDDLTNLFGQETASLVIELTRSEPEPQAAAHLSKKYLYELRTELLLKGIEAMSPRAQRIKLADRLSNWREAVAVRPKRKLERYRRQTQMILAAISRDVSPPLWDTLKKECDLP